ncbi:MAG: RidA family protein [Alphaproteobacteria bacterium]|nr:RidA family protein [Alphaproteobacteria bacterium]MBV9540375.1 RidA family protein [Alphaproteobacteria bacterium]MBV9903360.1 RidA family protein [Alphaproteobacteria bacterium]
MIQRFPGAGRPRSRTVVHNGLVFTVATAPVKSDSLYDQTKQALAFLDESLAQAGSDKSRVLQVTVYITDMDAKPEMNRAWEEWVDFGSPPQRACLGVTLEGKDLVELVAIAATG